MASELRPYQREGIEAIKQSLRNGVRRLMVQAPTGAGKTKVAASIARGCLAKGNRLAFCVPRIDLIDQTVAEFYEEDVLDVGVIQADHRLTDWGRPIQVCSIQTVGRKGLWPEASVVMFDEAHNLHKAHIRWMQDPAWAKVPFLGLSATPWTVGLGKYFESLLVMSTTKQLIADKYLSPFRVFAAQRPDLGNVKVVAGEYQEQQLSKVMQEGSLTADIVDTWQRRWGKGNTLCFCVDISHAKAVQQRFLDAGIRCGYQDCFTDQRERALIKKQFHDGVLQVVCNVDTLTVGVDWDCRCLILARPTRSEMKFVQIIGRALRTAPGKTEALILDHSDTHQRLGFVSDIHHEQLSNGKMDQSIKAKPRQKLPKECPTCTCMVSPGIPTCPNCGYVFPIRGVSEIVEEDGTLVEYTADGRKVGNPKAGRDYTMAEKVAFFGELKGYRIQNGKSEGWAAHVYKTKFGVWPNHPSIRDAAARVPGMAVKQYIRSRNIAYVKGLAKKGAVR